MFRRIGLLAAAHPWLIIWSTMPPAANTAYPANFDPIRDAVNTWIRANWRSLGIAALSDFGADGRTGIDGCEQNGTYYGADKTHPIDAGYSIWGATSTGGPVCTPPIALAKLGGDALGVILDPDGGAPAPALATGGRAIEWTPCGGNWRLKCKFIEDLHS